jgi:hypothetical protein
MPKYKCILLRSQYQTIEVEGKDYDDAEELARDMFNADQMIEEEYVEVYDMTEITKESSDE